MTLIDVHFENPILPTVVKLGFVHLKLMVEGAKPCPTCKVRKILEIPNIVAFQVEEVAYHQATEMTARGYDDEVSVSE